MPEAEVRVAEVKALETRSGNKRYVLVDENGKEYSTFKEHVAAKLPGLEGKRARITYHEQERNGFTNVYLDKVELLGDEEGIEDSDREAEEVAWKTAIDAAPWLVGNPDGGVPAKKFFEKLKPFKELVADDITDGDG